MNRMTAALLALLVAAPAATQEWQVARDQFTFVGTRLAIRVDVEAPGSLRLIRGESGTVRVASRARQGFTSAGLSQDDRLTLTAVGEGPVDYLVSVPENAWVEVEVPGRGRADRVARGGTESWSWDATERPTNAPATEWVPGMDTDGGWRGALYTTFSRDTPPEVVSVPDLSVVERISVRVEGHTFKVATSRPLSVDEGSEQRLVIRPASPPMELVLMIPVGTGSFSLALDGTIALIMDEGRVTTRCTPVTEQWLSHDRRWFTFNPRDGSLQCGGESVRRHGG